MQITPDHIRLFPACEDVFEDDISLHQQHFLPLVSVNLAFMYPGKNEWLHIVSPKEFYDGPVGEQEDYHTDYTRPDIMGFDVINGKYRFEADWRYFGDYRSIPAGRYADDYTDIEIEYNMNEAMYQLKKAYYQQYGELYAGEFNRPGLQVEDIRRLERLRALTPDMLKKDTVSGYLLEIQQERPAGIFTGLAPEEFPGDWPLPHPNNGFDYIGTIDGSGFQHTAPEEISLFYSPALKKAIVVLGNS
ncbi:hypothetical protein [Chitinophaga qingshengii]|uniref:Uncharacterized protein n=1 Tax=Chitinophaga qingshengii TaxID=1569794 RepID=A0ABR7TQR8_9BACT|nr:hypothetical protein [Chitinophaga qingshengii]MBC9932821.1 hypothetical protein [Chitinophaga qingshengii]